MAPLLAGGGGAAAAGLGFWGTGALLGGAAVVASIPGDTPTDNPQDKAARRRAKCSKILEENPHRPGGGCTGDSYTNHFHKCVQECRGYDG